MMPLLVQSRVAVLPVLCALVACGGKGGSPPPAADPIVADTTTLRLGTTEVGASGAPDQRCARLAAEGRGLSPIVFARSATGGILGARIVDGGSTCAVDAPSTARTLVLLSQGGAFMSPAERAALWARLTTIDVGNIERVLTSRRGIAGALADPTARQELQTALGAITLLVMQERSSALLASAPTLTALGEPGVYPDSTWGLDGLLIHSPRVSSDGTSVNVAVDATDSVFELRSLMVGDQAIGYLKAPDMLDPLYPIADPRSARTSMTITVARSPYPYGDSTTLQLDVLGGGLVGGVASWDIKQAEAFAVQGRSLAGYGLEALLLLLPQLADGLVGDACAQDVAGLFLDGNAALVRTLAQAPTTSKASLLVSSLHGTAVAIGEQFATLPTIASECGLSDVSQATASYWGGIKKLLDFIQYTRDSATLVYKMTSSFLGGPELARHQIDLCAACPATDQIPACAVVSRALKCATDTCAPSATACQAGLLRSCNAQGTVETSGACPSGACLDTSACAPAPDRSPTQLAVITQPASLLSSERLVVQPVIEVRDAQGARVDGSAPQVTARLASGTGTLGGKTTVTASGGVATFTDLAVFGGGFFTLQFTAASLAPALSQEFFTVVPALAVSPPSGLPGTTFVQLATILAPGGAVTFHLRQPDGVELPAVSLTADARGVCTGSWISSATSQLGAYQTWAVDATTGLSSPSATFAVTSSGPEFVCSGISSGTSSALYGVWGSSASDIWAVGESGTSLHWNGTAWSSVATSRTNRLRGVWGTGSADVWAVGEDGLVLRWNGSAWSGGSLGTSEFSSVWGTGVWGGGAEERWAVGGLTAVHWNTTTGATNFPGGAVIGIWGSAANDVWAVGGAFGMGSPSDPAALAAIWHWNGSAWTRMSVGVESPIDALTSVWGSKPGDVWAVGDGGSVMHWNGANWSNLPGVPTSGPFGANGLYGVWGIGSADVWAAGDNGMLLHWNGAKWSSVVSGTGWRLLSVWGSGANDVWAVGAGGTILRCRSGP